MADVLSPSQRKYNMSRIRGRNTGPEEKVKAIARKFGYRFQQNDKTFPGQPDLSFPRRKKVIFVHGCYWHRHSCPLGQVLPKTNAKFWRDKLEGNVRRDRVVRREIRKRGWKALVVWECGLKRGRNPEKRILNFLKSPGRGGKP